MVEGDQSGEHPARLKHRELYCRLLGRLSRKSRQHLPRRTQRTRRKSRKKMSISAPAFDVIKFDHWVKVGLGMMRKAVWVCFVWGSSVLPGAYAQSYPSRPIRL